jgi:hypothetical protein
LGKLGYKSTICNNALPSQLISRRVTRRIRRWQHVNRQGKRPAKGSEMTEESSKPTTADTSHPSGSNGNRRAGGSLIYETVHAFSGNDVVRVRSSLFYWGALSAFITGVTLFYYGFRPGSFLVMTLTPCLLLYPLVRFLFGGKDSVGAVITTVVVEEVVKRQILKALDDPSKRKRRK